MTKIISITHHNFETEIQNAEKPVVIDAYATWCGPCQHMAPYFEELANQYADTYTFAKLNVDEAREIAIKFNIMSVPTFLFLKKGALVATEIGYMSKDELESKIKLHLA
jgi:thioredoxin 1